MDELLSEVLGLQKVWTAKNTDEMKRRGVIIRHELPDWIRQHREAIAPAMGVPLDAVGVEGRDGTGLKTEIPWARVFDKERSSSATEGWYVVYLFSACGERVYLSLNQGTTVWTGGDFKARKPEDLLSRVAWARPHLHERVSSRNDLLTAIDLSARTDLGQGYEPGNVVAIEYRRDALPTSTVLVEDLLFMVGLLGTLYRAEHATPHIPGDLPPEVVEAEQSAAKAAGRRTKRRSGQGFLLTAAERRAIELHSVRLATEHFEAEGWSVKDVGTKESYDLLLSRGEERLHIEVKGTVSEGAQVILTRAEVEKQRKLAPHNGLVVVHSITLDRTSTPPTASGGVLHCVSPWGIEDEDLTVVSYIYRTGL